VPGEIKRGWRSVRRPLSRKPRSEMAIGRRRAPGPPGG
jgi:hypothetical protein